MKEIKCSDYTWRYNGKCFDCYITDINKTIRVNALNLSIGDEVIFVIENKVIQGTITKFEEPFENELYEEIDSVWIDDIEFSFCEMEWIGKL